MKIDVVLSALLALMLGGCASPLERAAAKAHQMPFEDIPAYYDQLLANGTLTEAQHQTWMQSWRRVNGDRKASAEAHRKMLASMTPAERTTYEFQQQQLELQRQQLAAQENQNSLLWQANAQQAQQRVNPAPQPIYIVPYP